MNLNIEKYLYSIDQSFASKSQRDISLIYGMIFTALFGLSYALFWDGSEAEYQEVLVERKAIEKKLNQDKHYLTLHPESEIQAIQDQIDNININTLAMKDNNAYIKFKIEKISELYYDEAAWGRYIDSISENAKRYGIKLKLLSNKLSKDNNKFGHVLNIQVSASGKYQKVLHFINAMEQGDLVIDIHDFNLSATETLNIDINSSVWGITR